MKTKSAMDPNQEKTMNHSHQAVVKPLAGAVLAALLLASGAQAADVSVYGSIDRASSTPATGTRIPSK